MPRSEKPEENKPVENKHKKQLLLNSKLFTGVEKDLLSTLLEDEKEYSISDCITILKKENGRTVK